MRAVEDFVSRASSEKVFKQDGRWTVCSHCEVAAFECWIFKMNKTKSKTMNRRALIGKLRFWWWGTFPFRASHGFMSKSLSNIYWRCPRSSWNSNLSRVEGSNVFQEFEEASQKAISTEYNIYIVCRPLGMEVSPLSSWSGNLWVATFSEWPWNFWKRLPSRRWIVNKDFIQMLKNCSC